MEKVAKSALSLSLSHTHACTHSYRGVAVDISTLVKITSPPHLTHLESNG